MRILATLALALALVSPALAQTPDAPRAAEPPTAPEWIARMNAALWPSDTVAADAMLTSADGLGPGLATKMKLIRTRDGERVRTQIRVLEPERAAGTAYEVDATPGKPLERIVYFPSMERTQNVSGIRRTDSFLASEFTYEDLDIAAPLESRWTDVDRIEEQGRALVRVTCEPYSYYSRVETFIDPATSLPVQVLYYDRAGRLYKRATYRDVKPVKGHPIPTRIEMDDVQTGARSELTLSNVEFDAKFDEHLFTDSPIAQRRANAITPAVGGGKP